MAHVFVTGAAGFIGSHTVDRLLKEGHRVTGADNFRTGRRENLTVALASPRFTLLELDMAREGGLAAAVTVARPDALIHLAALVSVQESMRDPGLNFDLNVRATHLAAEAARAAGTGRIVFASSAAIYGDVASLPVREEAAKLPISPYGAAKLASEALLLGHGVAFGLTVRCQRYFNVFGPRQDPASPYSGVISIFAALAAADRQITIHGDGQQLRDFVYVGDVVAHLRAAMRLLAEAPGRHVLNVCTGRATSVLELAQALGRLHGHAPRITHGPARAGDIRRSLGDPARTVATLGLRAGIALEDGLARTLASLEAAAA